MIDFMILRNLYSKFTRELTKGNRDEAKKVIGRLEKMYREAKNQDLGLQIYFTVRGMKKILRDG